MRKVALVNTYGPKYFPLPVNEALKSTNKYWPEYIQNYVYPDDISQQIELPRTHYYELVKEQPTLQTFIDRHKDNPELNPRILETQEEQQEEREFINKLMEIKGNPNATITMYQAAPQRDLREGDLITPFLSNAQFLVDESKITQEEVRDANKARRRQEQIDKTGAVDFIIGEKKKEYYNNIVNKRQELLSTDPVNIIIQTNQDIKTAVEDIESSDGYQKNILESELATALIQIQTDLGVPKYEQKVMTSDQSKSFVYNYKNGDQNTRIAMLQGLELQFSDLNNKAFQQLLNDGLPETAILSSYFQNPQLTEAFLSFDSEDKRKELKEWGDQNGVKFKKLQKDIRTSKAIRLFEDIVATNTGANSADTVEQMNSITEVLTYYTLNEMFTNSDTNEVKARKQAIAIIKDNFQIEGTYYIPKIWDGKKLLDSHIDTVIEKTEIIKDHYLDQWGAVAFGSMKDDTLTVDMQSEFNVNIKENGEWRNTSDGEGLIFGIILADGEFAPVKNSNGDVLEFNFDDDSYILPGTDIKMNMTLNDFMPDKSESASLPSDNLIFDENSKPKFAGLVETNKFFKYVKDKEGPFFDVATKATQGEGKLTIGYGRYGAEEGQTTTKKEAEQMLLEDIETRIPEVINAIPKFDSFSDELQQALFYEWFRGSLVQSPKTRKLINAGKFSEAAKEFLDNDEYRNAKKNKRSGIIKHMNLVAKLLNKEGTI